MTTPDVPLRMELTFEYEASPEQVWHALATADGLSAWFMPTEAEERAGGLLRFHMGEDASEGRITEWDPPRRLVYEEYNWAPLAGHDGAAVTPLVSEFVVEARSGGTCVVRVVTSAFGTGADWEQEFFDEMEQGWAPYFENLRLYLAHFPGQAATVIDIDAVLAGEPDAVWSALRSGLGATDADSALELHEVTGRLHRVGRHNLLARLEGALPGYLMAAVHGAGGGTTLARLSLYLFCPDAPAYVERYRAVWKAWLDGVAAPAR